MSVKFPTTEAVESENNTTTTTTTATPTYTFKTTEENRSVQIFANTNEQVAEYIKNTVVNSPKWRSYSQFLNDALIHYLNGEEETPSIEHIREHAVRVHGTGISATITPTLADEIEMLVNHPHTEWESKQDFYTCSLFSYINAGMPKMERR